MREELDPQVSTVCIEGDDLTQLRSRAALKILGRKQLQRGIFK